MKIASHQEDGTENLQELSCKTGLGKVGGVTACTGLGHAYLSNIGTWSSVVLGDYLFYANALSHLQTTQVPVTLPPFFPITAHQSPPVHQRLLPRPRD